MSSNSGFEKKQDHVASEKMSLVLKYTTGEEIRPGDRVLYYSNDAEIELVVCSEDDPEAEWYMQEFGGGIMILDPKVSGRTFIPTKLIPETVELKFVSRTDQRLK